MLILTAVTDAQGHPLTQPGPDGSPAPVLREAPASALTDRIQEVSETSFVAQAIRLDRCARNLVQREQTAAGRDQTDEHRWLGEPICLFLSSEEGGYARHGFWLQQPDGSRRFAPVPYIDMVIDEQRVERGDYERTFVHELAHTTLRLLVGDITKGPCRKMHQAMSVTDYPTALDEGWAEHFEVLVLDQTTNPWLRGEKRGRIPDLIGTWLSHQDGALRIDGVRQNRFVHRRPLPEAALEPEPDPWRVWLEGETLGAFLPDRLRSGQAMLSSEGVAATLFYRIVTSEVLRSRYRVPAFYERFLPPGEAAPPDPTARFSPYENVTLKLMAAMREMAGERLDPHRPLVLELIRTYARLFPDEAESLWQLFLETTWGATASREVAAQLEAMACQGRTGDLKSFAGGIDGAIAALEQLRAEILAGQVAPDANVGPELWVLNQSFPIPRGGLWNQPERTVPLAINLNTAEEHDLMTLPGVDLALAQRLVEARREMGHFRSLEDFGTVDGVTPDLLDALRGMQTAMERAGHHRRA